MIIFKETMIESILDGKSIRLSTLSKNINKVEIV